MKARPKVAGLLLVFEFFDEGFGDEGDGRVGGMFREKVRRMNVLPV